MAGQAKASPVGRLRPILLVAEPGSHFTYIGADDFWDDFGVMARRIVRVRLSRLLLTVALTVVAAPVASAAVNEGVARADDGGSEIAVGASLQATSDVTLHKAEIAKGSRVAVTKLLVRAGRLEGLSVALADGHVVKVTLAQLRSFFRVVRD